MMNTQNSGRSSIPLDELGGNKDSNLAVLASEDVRLSAQHAGFSDSGLVALPHIAEIIDAKRFTEWVQLGRAGTMGYLGRAGDDGELARARVSKTFPWARSAIVCFANYQAAQPLSTEEAPAGTGWIARYAWSSRVDETRGSRRPADYHKVLLKRLRTLESKLHKLHGEFQSRAYVDTGPVVERALATAAGIGWTAKNTCLIHPKLGSFGFLGVLLTSLPVKEGKEVKLTPDRCGSCRRCLDACPTGALFVPYQMDATRCISYLTIEHKGEIGSGLMEGMGRQVFGCDICQDVCPWNRKAPISGDTELEPRAELVNPALDWLAQMDEEDFARTFNGSPVRRAGWLGMRRNVAIAMGNSSLGRFAPRLRQWADAADEGLRAAARWALGRIEL